MELRILEALDKYRLCWLRDEGGKSGGREIALAQVGR